MVKPDNNATDMTFTPVRLTLSHVNHHYRLKGKNRPVLQDINLSIEPGEFVALLGSSGCGKSTLLRLIAGLEPPASGTIAADGQIITGPGPDRIVMFQDPMLYPWRNVHDNVALGLEIRHQKNPEAVQNTLRLVELEDYATAWPHQLSGGMAQRAALARALINNPRLIILDEPLGKLDSLTRLTLQTKLLHLWKNHGFTTLMVTHDVEEALLLATRIIIFSPRPARIIADTKIDLPLHRHRDDPQILALRRDILNRLGHSSDW